MPDFNRNIIHFIFDMFWVIIFGCYFVNIYFLFFDCKIDGAFSFKQNIIQGVTGFNMFIFHLNVKRIK